MPRAEQKKRVRNTHDESIGGLWPTPAKRKQWKIPPRSTFETAAHACKSEQWFVVQSRSKENSSSDIRVEFTDADGHRYPRIVPLPIGDTIGAENHAGFSIGWAQAPANAKTVRLIGWSEAQSPSEIAMRALAERDTKCHPLANVPAWSTYKPPFPIDRVVLPRSLAGLEPLIDFATVRVIDRPPSLQKLAAAAMGAAIVIDPSWIDDLELTLADIERVVPITWMVLDLDSVARLCQSAGVADARLAVRRSRFGLMSARVEYAEVPTRGFALMDVFPFGTYSAKAGFSARVLVSNRSWRKYAESSGFALLLGSQTPFVSQCNDVLSAMRAIGQGEMLATDLPWIANGDFGPPVAPALVQHALRMHLGGSLHKDARYWNRWDDMRVVVRDIADFVRRYPGFRALRWKAENRNLVSLGLALDCRVENEAFPKKRIHIRTGRIDSCDRHDGVAPEPMMILLRSLASEWQQRTPWAAKNLGGLEIVWQFETAEGERYATLYDAGSEASPVPQATLRIRASHAAKKVGRIQTTAETPEIIVPADVGVFGDRSLDFQRDLTIAAKSWIERE